MDNFRNLRDSVGSSWDLEIPDVSREELQARLSVRKKQKTHHHAEERSTELGDDDGAIGEDTGLSPPWPEGASIPKPARNLDDKGAEEATAPAPQRSRRPALKIDSVPLDQIRKNTERVDQQEFIFRWRAGLLAQETVADDAPSIHGLDSEQLSSQGTRTICPLASCLGWD